MVLSERILQLRGLVAFRDSGDRELILLAEVARPRFFPEGAVICEEGKVTRQVLIVVSGSLETSFGQIKEELLGMASVLFESPIYQTVHAGPGGVHCLVLDRSHVFTLVNESPRVLLSSLDAGGSHL